MSSTPRSNGDYTSVPNPVTAPPNDSSDITPPDISSSSSATTTATATTTTTTTTATTTADPDHIAPALAPATDSDPVVIDMQLLQLQKLYDDLVSVVTKPFLERVQLKPPFSELPHEKAGLLTKERARELSASDRNNAALLHDSIIRLFIDAVTPGMLENADHDDDDDDDDDDNKLFYAFCKMMSTLSRNLANDDGLIPEEHIMAARIGSIVYSLSDHLATLVDVEFEFCGDIVSLFVHVVYGAFFTSYLALKVLKKPFLSALLGYLCITQDDFKRLLPVIEAETGRRVVPRGATHCTAYTDVIESMVIVRNCGICTYEAHDENGSMMHGYWVEAEYKDGSMLVFRNLKCPGGDECPISCDRVQLVLRYKGDKSSGTKSKKKAKKAVKHKKYKPQSSKSDHNRKSIIEKITFGYYTKEKEEENDDDTDDVDDYPKTTSRTDEETGLMIPKDFIRNLVSRGVFGFERQPLLFIWHLCVVAMSVVMVLLAFGVINTSDGSGSAAANSADSNGNGNSTTTAGNIVSSGNVTNFIMRGVTYLASNASSFIAVISAAGLPGAFMALTWIREFKYPATTYFELVATKTAVTSFKEACKLKDNCPGCLTAASVRDRVALMFVAFGQYMGLVGMSSAKRTEAKACFDCHGSTTCLFRAGLCFIKAFGPFEQYGNEIVPIGDRYQKELPDDCEAWTKYCYEWNICDNYYLAQPNKAFLVREIPNSQFVAMVGYVDILNNKVGRLTYFKEPIVVEPRSTPMINFQYLM